jgi:hypothetical protein
MKPAKPKPRNRTSPAVRTRRRQDAALPPQDQAAPADRSRDERLQQELTEHSADTTAARHREGLTAIDSDADAVPEEEGALDAAAALEADERQARTRQPREDE